MANGIVKMYFRRPYYVASIYKTIMPYVILCMFQNFDIYILSLNSPQNCAKGKESSPLSEMKKLKP